jgi:site-specific recombinase XerD
MSDVAMDGLIDAFLADAMLDRIGASTAKTYRSQLHTWARACDNTPSLAATKAFLAGRKSPRTRFCYANTIRAFLRWHGSPWAIEIRAKQVHKRDQVRITLAEWHRLIGAIPCEPWYHRRNRALLVMAFATGVRVSEILNLRRDEIDHEQRKFHAILKGGEATWVYYPPEAAAVLGDWLKESAPVETDYVFFSGMHNGRPLSGMALTHALDKYAAAAGLGKHVTMHTLRRSIATEMLNSGAPLTVVQQFLHHKNIQTTLVYARQSEVKTNEWADAMAAKSIV